MTARPKVFRAADLFCGAGGFTTALYRHLQSRGVKLELVAVNHNPVAIATHTKNHPRARHYIEDLHTADPEQLVPEGRLDLLLASPTCTYHSRARGGKPTSDQQRMDPYVLLTWCTKLRIKRLACENVPEFVDWGPINPQTGKPIKSRKGEYFRAWVAALEGLGYRVDWRIVTAADHGDATTRRRFFLLARSDRKRNVWAESTHTRDGVADLFGLKAKWRPAREIINWQDRGRSIFARPVPLKPNTLRRVRTGAMRFSGAWAEVFRTAVDDELYRSMLYWEAGVGRTSKGTRSAKGTRSKKSASRVWVYDARANASSLVTPMVAATLVGHQTPWFDDRRRVRCFDVADDQIRRADALREDGTAYLIVLRGTGSAREASLPLPTVTAQGTHLGLAQPFVFQVNQANGRERSLRSVDQPLYTVLTRDAFGLADFCVQPFTCGNRTNNAARGVEDPIATIVSSGGIFLARPRVFLLANGCNGAPQPVDRAPCPSITTISRIQLVEPLVEPFVLGQHGGAIPREVGMPVPTIARAGAISLVQPEAFVLNRHSWGDGAPRHTTLPLHTVTQSGGGYLCEPYLTSYYGAGGATSIDLPVPTVTTKDRFGLATTELRAFLVPQFGEREGQAPRIHLLDYPLPAVTSHGAGALVEPYLVRAAHGEGAGKTRRWGKGEHTIGEPLPTVTGSPDFALVEPFLLHTGTGGFSARSVAGPLPTVTAGGYQVALAAAAVDADQKPATGRVVWVDGAPVLVDILFRMLRNPELAAAMSFTDEDYTYEFTGTETEITKQIGNAVPVRTARALIAAHIEDMLPVAEPVLAEEHEEVAA